METPLVRSFGALFVWRPDEHPAHQRPLIGQFRFGWPPTVGTESAGLWWPTCRGRWRIFTRRFMKAYVDGVPWIGHVASGEVGRRDRELCVPGPHRHCESTGLSDVSGTVRRVAGFAEFCRTFRMVLSHQNLPPIPILPRTHPQERTDPPSASSPSPLSTPRTHSSNSHHVHREHQHLRARRGRPRRARRRPRRWPQAAMTR